MWSGSAECGMSKKEVDSYVDRLYETGINTLIVHLKGGDGTVYWKSDILPQCTHPGYDSFDLPAALLKSCRARGMRLEAWLIDFFEGKYGPAHQAHPDWVALDPDGNTTSDEMLRGSPWGPLWMCPARRPGYTDQWLIPLLEEFARKYDFDAVHHDYVRYPGDAAPDRYCFCDYCLEHLPKWAGYRSEIHKEDPFFHEFYDRGYIEAHWEQSPRVLPANWDSLPRAFKARFLLEGGFFQGGRNDLDYFFYLYRREAITDFCRLAKDAVSRANPKMQISAAVFKNPVHSGRFIGQDWRTFEGYVDGIIPMNYRDHYPGSFDVYLDLLRETIRSQKERTKGFAYYLPGAAINFLFFEEERPLHAMKEALTMTDTEKAKEEYAKVRDAVLKCSPETASLLDRMDDGARVALSSFMEAIPAAYWPTDKLTRVIDVFEESGVDGFALFCVGHLDPYSQWDVLRNRLHP
jgi:hypothetical protein